MKNATCRADGCELAPTRKDLCQRHHDRLRRRGTLEPYRPQTLEERLWAKVDKNGPLPEYRPDLGCCWPWTAAKFAGYGVIGTGSKGETRQTHRVTYELLVGPIPEGLQLDHLCRVRACCNPSHLEPVTQAENFKRGRDAQQNRCKNGHEFTSANTIVTRSRGRVCRTCRNAWKRAHKGVPHAVLPARGGLGRATP